MADGDGWTSQLLAGLALHLQANGIGVWRPTGTYAAGEIAITVRNVPATPDRVITLTAYHSGGLAGMQDVDARIQARIRGTTDLRVCEDIGDAIFELLDSSGRQVWGDIPIVEVTRKNHTSLGQDGLYRWEASHNYEALAMRRTPHRTD